MSKTIIYLHGFGSSGQSGTVKHLRKVLPQFNVLAPDIPVSPSEALPFLKAYCDQYHPELIIGTSMGAMYAMQMHDYPRMCVNPALRMSELTDILKPGTFQYFQPPQSGATHFTITEDIIQQFRDMEAHLFDGVNDENRRWCWGFFGDNNTIVNCREEFESHFAPNVQTFHGEHRMNNKVIDEVVLPFVKTVLNRSDSKYKIGDWVKFVSYQPNVFVSRYADGDCKIEKQEYIGVIKNVHAMMKGFYTYTIITAPIHWICTVEEDNIITQVPDEYTDEWGVTYSRDGRVLKNIDPQRFTCNEYTIPEGVEVIDGSFWLLDATLHKIHLPSTLRKMEVNTFIRCRLEEIELPEGITEVPDCMCEGCRELKKVVLPSTIKQIRVSAFNCCKKLQEINLPDSIEIIEPGAFRLCESLRRVQLPPQITEICSETYYGSGVESIDIPESVTRIGYWAFCCCDHLKRLVIPECVENIDYGIVSAHEGFEGIECHAKGFHVENDALIDDERHELLCCWTQQKHYVVPSCVKRIADISCNEFVETITVHQPVELTTPETFASDTHLRHVDFQGGVTGITEHTFYNCTYGKKIHIHIEC